MGIRCWVFMSTYVWAAGGDVAREESSRRGHARHSLACVEDGVGMDRERGCQKATCQNPHPRAKNSASGVRETEGALEQNNQRETRQTHARRGRARARRCTRPRDVFTPIYPRLLPPRRPPPCLPTPDPTRAKTSSHKRQASLFVLPAETTHLTRAY